MKERILFAPGLNGHELTISLARYGVNSFNLRICGAAELARLALMRSGVTISEYIIKVGEEEALIAGAVKDEDYFGNPSYSDVQKISEAVRMMRYLVADEDEEKVLSDTLTKGIFPGKNNALLNVYRGYMKALSSYVPSDNKGVIVTDTIGLIRKAVALSKPVDAEFLTLEEYPLNPLQKTLLEKVSNGKYLEKDLKFLFNVSEKPLKTESIKNCYGAPNEVETIIADIYSTKSADRCTVAVTDTDTYSQLFFDYALLYDIPVTFGCGIPVTNSNPAKLIVLYNRWLTTGFFGSDALMDMINSPAFKRKKLYELFPEQNEDFSWKAFFETLGNLRLTNDRSVNVKRIEAFKNALKEESELLSDAGRKDKEKVKQKQSFLPLLETIAAELALTEEEFISKYSYIRRGNSSETERLIMNIDQSALSAICEKLKSIRDTGVCISAEDMIKNILKLKVCTQNSEEGKIHITDSEGSFSVLRDHIYIAGLSASNFPGSPKENYLLLDEDLKLFGDSTENVTSDERIKLKTRRLKSLIHLASATDSKIYISYAGQNVSDLKKNNASSVIYKLFRDEKEGENVTMLDLEEKIVKVGYFDPAISASRLIGDAYNKEKYIEVKGGVCQNKTEPVSTDPEREFSPTALETFFSCPRRFMLHYILGLKESDTSDPFEIISPRAKGNMAHLLMSRLGGSDIGLKEFLELSGMFFDIYVAQNPPLIPENTETQRKQFLEMMETAFEMEPHREILLEEEEIHSVHESGIKLNGLPDRVEKKEDGSCMIVDFKTGKKINQTEDDVASCLQVVLYAYMMEQKGYKISGCEYRYIGLGKTVSCRYDDDIKKELSEMLDAFKESLLTGSFPVAVKEENSDDPCTFCKYGYVCGKDLEVEVV